MLKINQRIKFINTRALVPVGSVGKIVCIDNDCKHSVCVLFDEVPKGFTRNNIWCMPSSLQIVPLINTQLSFPFMEK